MISTLSDVVHGIEHTTAAVETLTEPMTELQFSFQPSPNSWSVSHCLDHLTMTNRQYVDAIRPALPGARRGTDGGSIQPGLIERFLRAQLEPSAKRRLPAPGKLIPRASRDKLEVCTEFFQMQTEVLKLCGECSEVDLNRTKFLNPFVPLLRFRIGGALLITETHERRHLEQMRRVTASPDYPR